MSDTSLLMYGRWQWIDSTTKIISPSFLAYPIFEWQISNWLSMCIYHYSSLPFVSFITAHDPFYSLDIHIILLLSFKLVTISLSFFTNDMRQLCISKKISLGLMIKRLRGKYCFLNWKEIIYFTWFVNRIISFYMFL